MIEFISFCVGAVACVALPQMTQLQTICAFMLFFAICWCFLSWIEELTNNLNARRDTHRIRKGNRRKLNINVRLTHSKSLYIEETPAGKFARWM